MTRLALFALIIVTSLIYSCREEDDSSIELTIPPQYFLIDTNAAENLTIIDPEIDFISSSKEFSVIEGGVDHLKISGGYQATLGVSTVRERYSISNLGQGCILTAYSSIDTFVTYRNSNDCLITENYSWEENLPDSVIIELEVVHSVLVPRMNVNDTIYTNASNFVYADEYNLYDYHTAFYSSEEDCISVSEIVGEWEWELDHRKKGYIPFRLEDEGILYIGWIEIIVRGGKVESNRIGYYTYVN